MPETMPENAHLDDASPHQHWYAEGAADYARFRPSYPPELADCLAELAPARRLAVDVGCGSGQLTVQLARHFGAVVGVEPSADQVAHATAHPRVTYVCAPAEQLPVADASVAFRICE